MELSRNIFWDTRYESIQWDKNGPYVIDRVLHYGTLKDWKQVLEYYGSPKVRRIVINLRHMDKRVLSYCSIFFNLPKDQFRCYNIEPSLKKQWDY
jgi:hypothetical protein